MSTSFDPASYHDTFHDDILALVDKKIRAGKTEEIDETEPAEEKPRSADILDLSELLKRSLGRGKSGGGRSTGEEDGDPPARKTPKRRRAAG